MDAATYVVIINVKYGPIAGGNLVFNSIIVIKFYKTLTLTRLQHQQG